MECIFRHWLRVQLWSRRRNSVSPKLFKALLETIPASDGGCNHISTQHKEVRYCGIVFWASVGYIGLDAVVLMNLRSISANPKYSACNIPLCESSGLHSLREIESEHISDLG